MELHEIQQALVSAVTSAGDVCRKIQHQLVRQDTLTKSDRSPVTIADFASQAVVCRFLKRRCPSIPIVAEETAEVLHSEQGAAMVDRILGFLPEWSAEELIGAVADGASNPSDCHFTLDPVDGTKGFLRGDNYAVALGLIIDGQIALGALCCPNITHPVTGDVGVTCFSDPDGRSWVQSMNGGPPLQIVVSTGELDRRVRFLESVEAGHANHSIQGKIMAAFGKRACSVRVDSQAKYAMLAMGAADVYLRIPKPGNTNYQEKIWDHAAGAHVVHCAGGRVTDISGAPLDFGCGRHLVRNRGVIASCGPLHDEIVDLVKPLLGPA